MNHIEVFKDQIDSVEPISQEFVDNLITKERRYRGLRFVAS